MTPDAPSAPSSAGRPGRARRREAEISLRLPRRPESASQARHGLGDLVGRLDRELLDVVRLLVTELVTNSVRHAAAGPLVELDIFLTTAHLRIEVIDEGGGFTPEARTPGQSPEGGWGLHLVDRLADRWGVQGDGRTLVWLEIDLPKRVSAA